mmetsp:Transcript_12914/g.44838  ORF Transcript_12914/g.44838 Transcript_12914/m.44838 type:complete len:211 (+) Transcript_12914:2-634(+)
MSPPTPPHGVAVVRFGWLLVMLTFVMAPVSMFSMTRLANCGQLAITRELIGPPSRAGRFTVLSSGLFAKTISAPDALLTASTALFNLSIPLRSSLVPVPIWRVSSSLRASSLRLAFWVSCHGLGCGGPNLISSTLSAPPRSMVHPPKEPSSSLSFSILFRLSHLKLPRLGTLEMLRPLPRMFARFVLFVSAGSSSWSTNGSWKQTRAVVL